MSTLPGRIMTWMLTVGRHVVIFTELIVILSFASRFYLDRKVTDLNTEIFKKEVRLDGMQEIERKARLVQLKLSQYDQVYQARNPVTIFPIVARAIPANIELERLSIQPDRIQLEGTARSQTAFNVLISNLQLTPDFADVIVQTVEADDTTGSGYTFMISAVTQEIASPKPAQPPATQKVDILDRTQGL